ncbi:MAG TPA: hypothetical protein VF305_03455, partial [Smithellaceae bacterium]
KCELLAKMLPMTKSLPLLTGIEVEEDFANKLRDGMQPSVETMQLHVLPFLEAGDMIKFVSRDGSLVAVAEMVAPVNKFSEFDGKRQAAKIIRVFNNISN